MKRRSFLKAMLGAVLVPAIPVPTVKAITVHTETKALKSVWSFEAQQDLRAMHNLDAEMELTKILADEINKEIDAEVMSDLRKKKWRVQNRWAA